MRFNFNRSLDLDEIVMFFKNTKLKQPLLSFQLCDLQISNREVLKRRGFLSRYDNVWVNYYDRFIEVCAHIKKDDHSIYSSLLNRECEDSLIRRIKLDAEFGKDQYSSIIYGKQPGDCHESKHYHYEELIAQKEFSQRKDSNGYLVYDEEVIEYPTHIDCIELKKTKTGDGSFKFELVYYFDNNDKEHHQKEVGRVQYVWPENSFQSMFSRFSTNEQTNIFELQINENEQVLNFNYCGEGFFAPHFNLDRLIYFKEYKQSLSELDSSELLHSSEYKRNIEIGTIIYKTLKEELSI